MNALKPCCQIGAWPDHADIDSDIRNGRMGIRGIAKRYQCTKAMVEKHRKCLAVTGGPVNGHATREDEPEPEERLPGEDGGNWVVVPPGTPMSEVVRMAAGSVVQTPKDSSADSEALPSVEIVRVKQDGAGNPARARVFPDPQGLESRHDRREYVADLVASGQWHGRPTARRLQTLWGYSDVAAVWQIRSEAQSILDAHRGPLLALRAETTERLRRIGRQAKREGDMRAAIAAESEAAKIDGLVANGKTGGEYTEADLRGLLERWRARLERDGHTAALESIADEMRIWQGERANG